MWPRSAENLILREITALILRDDDDNEYTFKDNDDE